MGRDETARHLVINRSIAIAGHPAKLDCRAKSILNFPQTPPNCRAPPKKPVSATPATKYSREQAIARLVAGMRYH